jgi:hypothetical protein
MAKRRCLVIALLAGVLLSRDAFAAGPFGTIHVGYWQGGAYTDDTTGAFSYCGASATNPNGVVISIAQTYEYSWLIMITNLAWNLPENESLLFMFDGQSQFQIFAASRGKQTGAAV